MLKDPLTGVPAGLLTIVTVYVVSSKKYHHKNFNNYLSNAFLFLV